MKRLPCASCHAWQEVEPGVERVWCVACSARSVKADLATLQQRMCEQVKIIDEENFGSQIENVKIDKAVRELKQMLGMVD
jgi:hypothetical protein